MEYVLWVEREITRAGAYIEGSLYYELVEIAPQEYAGVFISKHIARFGDGTKLTFDLHVNADLEAEKYKFDYRHRDDALIWRKDRHIGHEDLGSSEHIHRGPDGEDNPEKFNAVEIDEVLTEIAQYQKDGSLP